MSNQPPVQPEISYIPPQSVVYCTPSSSWTDLNQYEADGNHPHAFYDRGYFSEEVRSGEVLDGDWDIGELLRFDQLLEYEAVRDHLNGIRPWSESRFADRCVRYIELGGKARGCTDPHEIRAKRESEIDVLIESVLRDGVRSAKELDGAARPWDEISVNISRDGSPLFNNRGQTRLALAQLLNIKLVPVQVVVRHASSPSRHLVTGA